MDKRSETLEARTESIQLLHSAVDDLFGLCPECYEDVPYLNVKKDHWKACEKCKTCWPISDGLFSSWQEEAEEDWQRNVEIFEGCRKVEPYYHPRVDSSVCAPPDQLDQPDPFDEGPFCDVRPHDRPELC